MRKHQMVGGLQVEPIARGTSASPLRPAEVFGVAVARFNRWVGRISAKMVEAQREKAHREINSHLRCLSDDALLGIGLDAKQIEHMRAKGRSASLGR